MNINSLGIDKSSLDGPIDWQKAYRNGIRWASIRTSFGDASVDEAHVQSMKEAADAGILRMPYHWYVPRKDPLKQAENFLAHVVGGDLPPMIDLEDYMSVKAYEGIGRNEILPWLSAVKQATGITPAIYSSPSYITSYLKKETWLMEYPLVIAHYNAPYPSVPLPWIASKWYAWQFVDGADAAYFGFKEAKGCAMYVWNGDVRKSRQPWLGNIKPSEFPRDAIVMVPSLRVRGGPGTNYPIVGVLSGGQKVSVLSIKTVNEDIWANLGPERWAAKLYQGSTYMKWAEASADPITPDWPDWQAGEVIKMPAGSGEASGTTRMFKTLAGIEVLVTHPNGVKLCSIPDQTTSEKIAEESSRLVLTGLVNKNEDHTPPWKFVKVKAPNGKLYWVGGSQGEENDPQRCLRFTPLSKKK